MRSKYPQLTIRVSPEEFVEFKLAADALAMSHSEFVVHAMKACLETFTPTQRAWMRERAKALNPPIKQ
jgi:uncharacterized protein (DUF1778 family)